MSYLILIAGLPGTGKTTFAEYLSSKMKIPWFSKDLIKEHLFDTVGFKSRAEKVALGIASMEILYHAAEAHLKVEQPVILENNFENASKPGLLRLMEKYKCPVLTVRFHTHKDVLAERFLIRDKSPERHRGHVLNSRYPEEPGEKTGPQENQFRDVTEFWKNMGDRGMDTFSIGGWEIDVDTTDFSMVSFEEIYKKIQENSVI